MSYRFNLQGTEVTCDSVQELLAAIGAQHSRVLPTTEAQRARVLRPARSSAAYSWAVAEFYSGQRGNMGTRAARSALAADPGLKERVVQQYEAAMGAT